MCGIAGVVGERDDNLFVVEKMLQAIAHRGPDGYGTRLSSDNECVLGHRRLAIIDVEGGKQPLSNEDGTIWVSFNGCIYNYLELAQSLRQKGHVFKTHSDTEVIVHAYEEYGPECIHKFIGMFAFALWDEKKKELFCARDRLGVKPFYHILMNGRFYFASEIKSLLVADEIKAEPDNYALQEYLTFQAPVTSKTLFHKIERLLPGHTLTYNSSDRNVKIKQYWDISFETDAEHDEEYFVDRFRMLIKDAVKIRLRSDVALGAHLSGGLDSSTVACLASDYYGTDDAIHTFTGSFSEGSAYDETEYAHYVADKISAVTHLIVPKANDFIDCLPKIIFHMDEPAAGPGVFPQFMVSKTASEHVKVVLGGQGGDENFAGYARYLVCYLEECLKGAIENTSETASYAATLSSIIPSLPMLQQYIPMLKMFWQDGLFGNMEDRYYRLMDRSVVSKGLFCEDVFSASTLVKEKFDDVFLGSNAQSFLNKMVYFDMKVHLPALLHVEDRTSMAWGLESRVPLLDHRLTELIAQVPTNIKFKSGTPKYLFRKAIKNMIPDKILNRKDKMGFPVPLQKWFQNDVYSYVSDILISDRARQRGLFDSVALEKAIKTEQSFGRGVWGALCIELWFREFIDG